MPPGRSDQKLAIGLMKTWVGAEHSIPINATERQMNEIKHIKIPANLNEHTAKLVCCFAEALAEKLRDAELKYEYSDGWLATHWEADCRQSLHEHIAKGDPRDVAAFCAFMWHHGWSTKGRAAA